MKNQRGITLVALVITIVILLILSGIVILTLTQTGLLENAKQAKEITENAQKEENNILGQFDTTLNNYISTSRDVTENDLNSMFYPNKQQTLTLTNNSVEIPKNGWLYLSFNKNAQGDYFWGKRNNMEIFRTSVPTMDCADSTYIPVKKGDIISVSNSSYFVLTLMYFEE